MVQSLSSGYPFRGVVYKDLLEEVQEELQEGTRCGNNVLEKRMSLSIGNTANCGDQLTDNFFMFFTNLFEARVVSAAG